MADLAGIGSIISGIGGIGVGIANSVSNAEINKKNYELQKDWQNYQKQLQREIFQREDSAIQRRASDIAAAGGNPAMAWETGNGASAGSIVDTSAPQQAHDDYSQLMNSSLSMFAGGLKQFQEARLIDAQIKNLSAVTDKTDAETITEEIRQLQLTGSEEEAVGKAEVNKSLGKLTNAGREYFLFCQSGGLGELEAIVSKVKLLILTVLEISPKHQRRKIVTEAPI